VFLEPCGRSLGAARTGEPRSGAVAAAQRMIEQAAKSMPAHPHHSETSVPQLPMRR
jgi:hypothetical protein